MSGIKQPIQDILTKLAAINVTTADELTTALYARIWNNQLRDIKDGKTYDWQRPAAFVEVVNPAIYEVIGLGFRSADLGIRIHLIHDYYNQDTTLEQDLTIFDLRDTILLNLSQYCPTACGPLNCIREEQDYDHDNMYHYILEFVTNFTDSKGSPFDPSLNNYNEVANPSLDASIVDGGVPAPVPDPNPEFIIPQQNY